MLKNLVRFFFLSFSLTIMACSANATGNNNSTDANFQAGKDYVVIAPAANIPSPPDNKISVTEFFSYGCPACNHFEPSLEQWLKTKPKDIVFDRVPVVFHDGWDVLARAYYVAKDLGVAEKLSPAIFDAIHKQGQDLTNENNLEQFFIAHGVNKNDFESAYHFSPGTDAKIMNGNNLMQAYNIYQVPTIVVDGKYQTNIAMTNSDAVRFFQVVNYLIKKERQDRHIK